jgi:hypothetical protein
MLKKEKVAKHNERKAMTIVGQILGRGFGRDSEYGFLKLSKSDLSKVYADPNAKTAGKLFSKAGDAYLNAGKYPEARISYMSAIETYSGDNPKQDTPVEAQFRKYCALKNEEAKKLQQKKESELREMLEDGHFLAHSSNAMRRPIEFSIAVISLIVGIFFLSPNLTGNVIGNITNSTSNIIGAVLLLVGIVGAFFWFRNR